jgi:hypothetical protein
LRPDWRKKARAESIPESIAARLAEQGSGADSLQRPLCDEICSYTTPVTAYVSLTSLFCDSTFLAQLNPSGLHYI